jgi:dUTPase
MTDLLVLQTFRQLLTEQELDDTERGEGGFGSTGGHSGL